jgi:glycerol kinase
MVGRTYMLANLPHLDAIAELWHCQREFTPVMSIEKREKMYAGWLDAVQRVTYKPV